MGKFNIVNAANYKHSSRCFSNDMGPSQTVPDMSIDIREMMNRHKSGGRVKTFSPVYVNPDQTLIPLDFERMDKVDRQQMANQLADFVKVGRARLISARQQAKLDAQVAALDRRTSSMVEDSIDPIVGG